MQQPVPTPLRNVARIFVLLQEQRQTADYNNRKEWNTSEVEDLLYLALEAFNDWAAIRTDTMAGNYLLAMLLKKR
jgi:hypothetical protein